MYKKLKYTLIILSSLICIHIFCFNNLYAMSQKEVGEAIATFALNFQKAPDGGQAWSYDTSGYPAYVSNRAQAYKGNKIGDKFLAECVGWVSMCLHFSIGLDADNVSNGNTGFVTPYGLNINYDGRKDGSVIYQVTDGSLMPGDILQNNHHVMVYVGNIDGEDRIVHSFSKNGLSYHTFAEYKAQNDTAGSDINGVYLGVWRISESYASTIDASKIKTTWNGSDGDYSFGSSSSGTGSSVNLENFEGNSNFKPDEDDTKKDYRVVNPNDKLPIYKHILLTEKYNFNKVKWKRYGHGFDGSASPTKSDLELGLRYPSDTNNTKLGKFVSLVLPYIQTWYIPLAMYSGILTSEGGKMNYGGSGSTGGVADYSGDDVAEIVWNFLTSKGLSEEQTAGIMGNIYQESKMDPEIVNSSSGAYGLCQWLGGRMTNLSNFASSENKDVSDVTLQVDFLWGEMTGENPNVPPDSFAGQFESFLEIETIEEAVSMFRKGFERCGEDEAMDSNRLQAAFDYYERFQGTSGSVSEGDQGKDSDVKISKAAKNINFPYSIIKNGYHEIIVNRYDVQSYTLNTKYREYIKYDRQSVGTIRHTKVTTKDSDGKILKTSINTHPVSCKSDEEVSKEKINTRKSGNGIDPMLEDFVGSSTDIKTSYYLHKALTFDMLYKNEFTYTKYDDDAVEARIGADSESVVNREPYNKKYNEENRFTTSDMKGGSPEEIASSVGGSLEKKDSKTYTTTTKNPEGKIITTTSVTETYIVKGKIFTEEDGEEIYVSRNWSDKLSQGASESKQLDYDELIKYNENEDKNSSRDSITKEEFEKSKAHEYRKYRIMGRDGTINLIDYMNSNPKIIKTYLNKGAEQSKYMGYLKNEDLLMSYDVLKDLIDETKDESDVVPYAYFISLGYKMGYANSSINENNSSSTSGFGWPVDLTNNDGARIINCIFPYTEGYGESHGAIDIARGDGLNIIIAAKDGKVIKVQPTSASGGYGNSVVIEHSDGYYTRYSHLASINSTIYEGTEVKKGQPLGIMGTTGKSTGVHLDFTIYKDGLAHSNRIDPLDFYETIPEYGSIDPSTIKSIPSGYMFKSEKGGDYSDMIECAKKMAQEKKWKYSWRRR